MAGNPGHSGEELNNVAVRSLWRAETTGYSLDTPFCKQNTADSTDTINSDFYSDCTCTA